MKTLSIKLLRRGSRSLAAGFTLTELLVGIAISGITLTLSGAAMVSVMQSQESSAVEVSQRTNLNRALDFMANEVRMARSITAASNPTTSCGTATGVLNLTMPNNSQVTYALQTFGSCSSTPWSGPAAIYRRVGTGTPQLLVDAIDSSTRSPAPPTGCTGGRGFYACISSNGRTADLVLSGELVNAYGSNTGTYRVNSQVSARSF